MEISLESDACIGVLEYKGWLISRPTGGRRLEHMDKTMA
jgi:hypothetical protein